jgi:hypothetical protein
MLRKLNLLTEERKRIGMNSRNEMANESGKSGEAEEPYT